jgi:hypothetical protein
MFGELTVQREFYPRGWKMGVPDREHGSIAIMQFSDQLLTSDGAT